MFRKIKAVKFIKEAGKALQALNASQLLTMLHPSEIERNRLDEAKLHILLRPVGESLQGAWGAPDANEAHRGLIYWACPLDIQGIQVNVGIYGGEDETGRFYVPLEALFSCDREASYAVRHRQPFPTPAIDNLLAIRESDELRMPHYHGQGITDIGRLIRCGAPEFTSIQDDIEEIPRTREGVEQWLSEQDDDDED